MFWRTMVSKEYTGCVRSQTINAPEFWKTGKKVIPSIGGRSLIIKKFGGKEGGGRAQLGNFKRQRGSCNVSLKRSLQDKNFCKKSFGLQKLLKNIQSVSEVKFLSPSLPASIINEPEFC